MGEHGVDQGRERARLVALAPVDGADEETEDAREEEANGVIVRQPPVQREILADHYQELLQEAARLALVEAQRLRVRCRHLQLRYHLLVTPVHMRAHAVRVRHMQAHGCIIELQVKDQTGLYSALPLKRSRQIRQ